MLSKPRKDLVRALDRILAEGDIHTLFQPILRLDTGCIAGFALHVRGGSCSPLYSPTVLFRTAEAVGRLGELESLVLARAVRDYKDRDLRGDLHFTCRGARLPEGWRCARLEGRREPGRICYTVRDSELEGLVDTESLSALADLARREGVGIGLDLNVVLTVKGARRALEPDFFRLSRYLSERLGRDPAKRAALAETLDSLEIERGRVIAEGVEEPEDLQAVRDLKLGFAQGHVIAKPVARPGRMVSSTALRALCLDPRADWSGARPGDFLTERSIVRALGPVSPQTPNARVFARFEGESGLDLIPVVDGGRPVGLISRMVMIDQFARPFRQELYGRQPCSLFMDPDPLVVERGTGIVELAKRVTSRPQGDSAGGFIVTDRGQYFGVVSNHDLMREITAFQIDTAREANPLTKLPGRRMIDARIRELLSSGSEFVVCYADLDHFKPFNDVYGYAQGDEVIRLVAQVLGQACEPDFDLLGHIGGDDFIAVLASPDWRGRWEDALARFAREIGRFFSQEDLKQGGYVAENRTGRKELYPLTALSVGAARISPGLFPGVESVAEAATRAKKEAKKVPGSNLLVLDTDPSSP